MKNELYGSINKNEFDFEISQITRSITKIEHYDIMSLFIPNKYVTKSF